MENPNNEITNEELARMIAKGFEGAPTKQEMNARFEEVNAQFNGVNARLDRLEGLIDNDYKRRIEKLEHQVTELRDALAMK